MFFALWGALMTRIVVKLGRDRNLCGVLSMEDETGACLLGPFPVAARASDAFSALHQNSSRDPELRYGDTPVGHYRLRHHLPSSDLGQFGPGILVLEPAAGAAALAEANGRARFFIHGGKTGPDGMLRSTSGALRLADAHMQLLLDALPDLKAKVTCVISEGPAVTAQAVYVDPHCEQEDPPRLPSMTSGVDFVASPVSRRDVLRASTAGAAGLMALNLSVSFVALDAMLPSRAFAETAYGEPEQPPQMQPLSPEEQSELHDAPAANSGGKLEPFTPNPPVQNLEPAGPAGAVPANGAMQQLNNMTNGSETLNRGFDGGQGGPSVTVQPSTTTAPSAAPSLPPAQQQLLDQDKTYQGYVSQQSAAEKSASEAAAKSQSIQSQINTAPNAETKSKLQVELYNARKQESDAKSAADAARINADDEKAKVIRRGTAVIKDN